MKIIFYVNLVISVDEALSHCKREGRVGLMYRGAQEKHVRVATNREREKSRLAMLYPLLSEVDTW